MVFLPRASYPLWTLTGPLVLSFNCWHQARMTSLWTRLTGGRTAGRGGMGIRVGAFGGFTPSQRCDMSPGPQAVLFFVSLFLLVPCAEFFAISASPEVPCPFSASTDVGLQLIRSSDFSVELFWGQRNQPVIVLGSDPLHPLPIPHVQGTKTITELC